MRTFFWSTVKRNSSLFKRYCGKRGECNENIFVHLKARLRIPA